MERGREIGERKREKRKKNYDHHLAPLFAFPPLLIHTHDENNNKTKQQTQTQLAPHFDNQQQHTTSHK